MPDTPEIRASDADRERAADTLRAHCTAGRLTLDELSERLGEVYAARTMGDLDSPAGPFRQLPALPAPPPAPVSAAYPQQRPPSRRPAGGLVIHFSAYVLGNLMLVMIWATTTPGGYFWPMWPIMGGGAGVAAHFLAARPRAFG